MYAIRSYYDNGHPAIQITGSAAPGYSSGQAMDAMQEIVTKDLLV